MENSYRCGKKKFLFKMKIVYNVCFFVVLVMVKEMLDVWNFLIYLILIIFFVWVYVVYVFVIWFELKYDDF